jgi:beta-barrel assembly-enhancing protease
MRRLVSRCPDAPPRSRLAVLLAILGGASAGCSTEAAAEILISPEEENMLGQQIKADLEKGTMEMPPIRYLQDPELRSYILGLAQKVVDLGKKQRPEFTWSVEVIDDPGQVNAFATPGGYLYVFTGLLRAADNEAEVVGVMGHEVGHVLRRHYAQQLVKTYTLQGLIAIALGQDPGVVAQLAAGILAQGYLLAHSREAETQADEVGARLTSQAMYDPHALATFFAKLEMLQGETPAVLKYLMGHPPPADRRKHIEDLILEEKLPIGVTNQEMFARMKTRLPAGLPMGSGADGGAPHD